MVKWLKVASIAVVALLVAASASGDSNTYNYQDNGTAKFNPKSGQRVTGVGDARVSEADKDRDLIMGQSSIVGDTLIAMNSNGASSFLWGADSSIALPLGNARHLTFWIDAKGVSAKDVRLAFQLRLHTSSASDSATTAAWSPNMVFGYGYAAKPDSVGDIAAAPASGAALSLAALSDEILVRWDAARFNGSAGGYYSFPRMKVMMFEIAPGVASYFSVRVRNISGGNASPRVTITYKASAL